MQLSYVVKSEADTEAWARKIGSHLRGGEVIELIGDLGSGKTTIVKSIVAGTGSSAHVSSPTFAITKQYAVPQRSGRALRTLLHADLYRLPEPGLMAYELMESVGDPTVTLLIEWGAAVANLLPTQRLTIQLYTTSENVRRIEVDCPDELNYLVERMA